MAGHSHAKTIKHRKNSQDAKRSKIFTKIQKEIFIAVKNHGADEKFNPKLRLARQKARLFNMPNDKIHDAIKRATSSDANSSNYEECYYLISATGGVFILLKALTDNKNRTASEIRGVVSKAGATIAESATIDFIFENIGVIIYEAENQNFDNIFEKSIDLNASDIISSTITEETEDEEITHETIEVICSVKHFNEVKTGLEGEFGEPKIAELQWRAKNKIEPTEEQAEKINKLIDEFIDIDDISSVYKNFD
jgi:YebC/PmpR family DNA-binding regulatory protein